MLELSRVQVASQADVWVAIGVWATLGVYLVIATVAYSQYRESRRLRMEQSRPFVLVDVSFRSVFIELSISNIGATVAKSVSIEFDESLTSTQGSPGWLESPAFSDGIEFMAPGREIRFFLDSFESRSSSDQPMIIRGSVSYDGPIERKNHRYSERFVIDLTTYAGSQLPKKEIHELVENIETISKEIAKWTDGGKGIQAHVSDSDRRERRSARDRRLRQASTARQSEGGIRGVLLYWLRRLGIRPL